MMNIEILTKKIQKLPIDQQQQVEDFVKFLETQYAPKDEILAEEKKHKPLKAGFLKGTFIMKDDFDEPLDDFKEYME